MKTSEFSTYAPPEDLTVIIALTNEHVDVVQQR